MSRTKVPRASIACTLVRDPDYVRMVAEHDVDGLAAVGLFVGLLCLAKDQGCEDGVLRIGRGVRARLLAVDEITCEGCLALLSQTGWVRYDGDAVTIRSWKKWNPNHPGWGGRRDPVGGRPTVPLMQDANQDGSSPSPSPSPIPSPGREEIMLATFDRFWIAYPRKVGKPAALRAWGAATKRSGGDPERLLRDVMPALEKARRTEQWQDRDEAGALRWVPHPATWLNQQRWEDDEGQADLEMRREIETAKRRVAREEDAKRREDEKKGALPKDELMRRLKGVRLRSVKEA